MNGKLNSGPSKHNAVFIRSYTKLRREIYYGYKLTLEDVIAVFPPNGRSSCLNCLCAKGYMCAMCRKENLEAEKEAVLWIKSISVYIQCLKSANPWRLIFEVGQIQG